MLAAQLKKKKKKGEGEQPNILDTEKPQEPMHQKLKQHLQIVNKTLIYFGIS